jgi:hypothetical protein
VTALASNGILQSEFLALETRETYQRDGYLRIDSLTTADDIARIRSLLQPLFDRFDSLGRNAAPPELLRKGIT